MKARSGLIAVAIIGVVMIAGTLALSLPGKTAGTERLTDAFRPVFTTSSIAQSREDIDAINAMAKEVQPKVLPGLAKDLGMTPKQLQTFIGQEFPEVAKGLGGLEEILPTFNGLVDGLEGQKSNFEKADAIPIHEPISLPATTVPWLLIVPGALVAAFALFGLFRPGDRPWLPFVVAAVVGAALIVLPLALNVPGKTKAVDGLTNAFRPAFTEPGTAQLRTDFDTVQAMDEELEGEMLPALATQLKVSPTQLEELLGKEYPAFAAGLAALPESLPRFDGLVGGIEANQANFNDADSIPWASTNTTTLLWLFIVPGGLLLLVGGISLFVMRSARTGGDDLPTARSESPVASGR